MSNYEELLERADGLAQGGHVEEAVSAYKEAIGEASGQVSAYYNLALLHHSQGHIDEAIANFEKVAEITPRDASVFNNLGVLYYGKGMLEEAEQNFKRAIEINPAYSEALHNLRKISPKMKREKPKLAFFCGPNDKFIGDIITHFSSKYEVKRFQGKTIQEVHDLMKWSDISWFEWCDNLIIQASKLPKVCKIVCRLHSYEAFTNMPGQVDWKIVDDLIFVAPHIREIVLRQLPNLDKDVDTHIVYNGVDLEKYSFKERQRGFDLAYVGYINYKKNPSLLLQCIRHLADIDDRYILHIAGQHQDLRLQLYFDKMIKELSLTSNIRFHGWVDNITNWLEDKHYIVLTSVLEGCPVGIMEAMARGLKPLIHNWVGAERLYPDKYRFNTIDEFAQMVLSDNYNSKEYRKFIEDNYPLTKQLSEIEKLFESVLSSKSQPLEEVRLESVDKKSICGKATAEREKKISEDDVKSYYNHFVERLKRDHEWENPRHHQAKETLKEIIRPGMKVLDIGCGTGITSKFMGELGANVLGVDISDELIAFAQSNSAHRNVRYIVADATRLNVQEKFDAITIIDSMEHMLREKFDDYFQAIFRHASEETVLYLNIPDGRYQRYIKSHHPGRLQIVDEDYDLDFLISSFKKIGFQPYRISIYGLDVPVQYNQYLFMTEHALENMYTQALKRFRL